VRLWKVALQKFADETGLTLHIHHYPPGTSKWNKIVAHLPLIGVWPSASGRKPRWQDGGWEKHGRTVAELATACALGRRELGVVIPYQNADVALPKCG
jgi:hypothetical protein